VNGRCAKRVGRFPLIPAVCVTFSLAAFGLAACGSGATSGTVPGTAPAGRVPASARVLMVSVTYPPGSGPPGSRPDRPVSATITDVARVRQVAGLIDGLSLAWPGEQWSCPAVLGGVVKLAFRNSARGATLAAAEFNMGGCPGMGLTIAGALQILNIPGDTFPPHLLRVAGVPAPTGL
jgi:hypothetical protein